MATAANAGKLAMLNQITGQAGGWSLVLHTGADLTATSTTANIVEANFAGYARKSVVPGAPVLNNGVYEAPCTAQTFSHNGGAQQSTVTHWVIADMGFGVLYCFEKLTANKVFAANGDTLTVTPKITLAGNP